MVLAILQSVARATYPTRDHFTAILLLGSNSTLFWQGLHNTYPTRDHQERTSTLQLFYYNAAALLYFVIKRGATTFILVKGARNSLSL